MIFMICASWGDSFGVSGEQRSISDVFQSAVQHNHSFETDTSSTVRIGSVFEAFDVVLNSCRVDSLEDSSLFKHFWFVDSLSSRKDFFSSHEEIE